MFKKMIGFILLFFIMLSIFLVYRLYFKNGQAITILYTTDLQGFIAPHNDPGLKGNPMIGGSAYLATYLKKERAIARKKSKVFLLLDTGDIFLGTPEGYFSKGSSVIEIMNLMGYDAMTVGDRDFAFGEENLRNLAKQAKFPLLAANIISEDTERHPDYIKPYVIKEYEGIKVGIIGATAPLMRKYTLQEHSKGLKFTSPLAAVKRYALLLEEKGTDLIVVLSHLGLKDDKELAREVPNVDFIVGGGDKEGWRRLYIGPLNKAIIGPTWHKGCWVPTFNLDLDLQKNKIIKYHSKDTIIYTTKLKPAQEIQAIIDKYSNQRDKKKSEVIGFTEEALYRSIGEESALGNWIADTLRAEFKADIAFIGGLESDLEKGDISVGDIYKILPILHEINISNFNVTILELVGEEIKDVLEHSVSWALENSKYGILQVSGLKMSYNPNNPKDHRVEEITVDGEPLDLNKIYKVAVNGYLAAGGDRYYKIQFAENLRETGIMTFYILIDKIRKGTPINTELDGRIIKLAGERQ